MKVAILAGGMGSRLAEETEIRPKPMVEIGGYPILWHIMRHFDAHGFNEFAIALGYKGDHIKRFFTDYLSANSSLRVDLSTGSYDLLEAGHDEKWVVDLIDTGRWTNTGGRIKRLAPYLGDETFMLTWGDGVSDVDLGRLVQFHRSHGRIATVTAVHPPARFGQLEMDGDRVSSFSEKPIDQGWINGAFFVLEPAVFDYIDGDDTLFEKEPMERLAGAGQLMAYRHEGFWQCMDTMRDKKLLEDLWADGNPPWKTWG
jgi:glucose-1-phosphate cytidylyltransferase